MWEQDRFPSNISYIRECLLEDRCDRHNSPAFAGTRGWRTMFEADKILWAAKHENKWWEPCYAGLNSLIAPISEFELVLRGYYVFDKL